MAPYTQLFSANSFLQGAEKESICSQSGSNTLLWPSVHFKMARLAAIKRDKYNETTGHIPVDPLVFLVHSVFSVSGQRERERESD